jgi:hypothetical protein
VFVLPSIDPLFQLERLIAAKQAALRCCGRPGEAAVIDLISREQPDRPDADRPDADRPDQRWLPIPGHEGYETNGVDFRGVDRVIIRSDGMRYTVKGRKLKISAHRPSGFPVVKLSNGRAGGGQWRYVHLLLAATFGGDRK